MHARERIIRERFATRSCETCGQRYTGGGVLVLARRSTAWMVLVTCAHCEHRGIYVVSFPADPLMAHERWDGPLPTRQVEPVPPLLARHGPVSVDDVTRMHDFLSRFDGDFRRLFSAPPPDPSSSSSS